MQQDENPPRSWRELAKLVMEENDTARTIELSKELIRALEAEQLVEHSPKQNKGTRAA